MTLFLDGNAYHPTSPRLVHPPVGQEYPFDRNARRLSEELERVGWDVQGWDVVLRHHGTGDDRWVSISAIDGHIAGAKFRIRFGRADGGLCEASVPHKDGKPPISMRIVDESRTEMQVYCGDRWDDEYLDFHAWACPDAWKYIAADGQFVAENGKMIAGMTTAETGAHIDRWLQLVVDRVAVLPERRQDLASLVQIDPEPLKRPVEAWLMTSRAMASRVDQWRGGVELKPWLRYAALPLRPVVTDQQPGVPDAATCGHAWLALRRPHGAGDPLAYLVHRSGLSGDAATLRAVLRVGNDASVADFAAFRAEQARQWSGRASLDDDGVASCWTAMARTMVPLSEYQGTYDEPVLLLARELRLDEVEVVA